MILDARRVAELQYFLMDAAKRYIIPSGAPPAAAEELLASAAALDYMLFVSSQHAGGKLDDNAPEASSVRETMTRATGAALEIVAIMLRTDDAAFDDFVERHIVRSSVSELVRDFLQRGVVRSDDVAFRCLTLASEIVERRGRRSP